MNDIVLSSLLNLFALFEAGRTGNDTERLLSEHFANHLGLKDVRHPLDFYRSMRDYYESLPGIDKASVCGKVASRLRARVPAREMTLVVLRFMEFRYLNGDRDTEDFRTIADKFEIGDDVFGDMLVFAGGAGESESVKTIAYGGGTVTTLLFKEFDTLLFSYRGEGQVRYNDIPVLNGSFLVWQRSGVVKFQGERPLYYFNARKAYNPQGKKSTQLKLRGNEIEFRYGKESVGIHNFSFNLYEGELVAIMGGSGTGKTTLLSLLNGSIRPQSGRITINGHGIDEPAAKALIGYVPQDDLLIGNLTVYQNLYYTARLCFDGLSEKLIDEKVLSMLHDLGLEAVKDLKVGTPIDKYISGGQRKRLNVALELVREPDVLFLDEPTSGLSSSDSLAVMDLLREQVYKGRLIVVNIHQPSSAIFKMFDRLWILDVGGYPIYDGNPIEALTYFKRAAGYVDDQTSVCPMCGNVDSETILSIVGEKVIDNDGLISDKRKRSPQEWHELYLKTAPKTKDKVEELPRTVQKKPSVLKQMWIYFVRNAKTKFSDRQWLLVSLLEAPVLALVCSLMTRFSPPGGYTLMDNKNFVSYLFMAVIVVTFLGMSGSAEEIIKDRALLKREKFLGLSNASYIWSKIAFMALVSFVQCLLFIAVGNCVMEVRCLFGEFLLILFCTEMLAALTGLLLSQWFRSVVAIYITIPILLVPQILLCGLVVKFPDLAPDSRTANVPVIGDVIPSRWAFEALAVTTFSDNDYEKYVFDSDKAKYEARYYEMAYLRELRSQLAIVQSRTQNGEPSQANLDVVRKSLPRLLDVAGMEPYGGEYSYGALKNLLDSAAKKLSRKSVEAGRASDRAVESLLADMGMENVLRLKQQNFNLQLERLLVDSESESMLRISGGYIVPQAGYVYLDPATRNGRAPFFSSCKIVGDLKVKTLWFNIAVLLLMCGCNAVLLMLNLPGRIFRKN